MADTKSGGRKGAGAKKSSSRKGASYGADSIQVLKGLEAVRQRPGMYIGSTDAAGLHHLCWEVIDNSVDEALAGYCTRIICTLHSDGSFSVQDNGRGIPTGINAREKKSGVELALTVLHAGGKFSKNGSDSAYGIAGGLHGVGVSVVNALSTWCEVTVEQAKRVHVMRFENGGKPTGPLRQAGRTKTTGTLVRFLPDAGIFESIDFDRETIADRLRQTAMLNAGLTIILRDEREKPLFEEKFFFKDGLREMVVHLQKGKETLHGDVIHGRGEQDNVEVEIALRYHTGYGETLLSFANNIATPDGGSHVTGFRAALTNVMSKQLKAVGTRQQQKLGFTGSDLVEGLTCVLAVRLREPQFAGQTKSKLNNPECRTSVQSLVSDLLNSYFAQKPRVARAILGKAALAAKAREAQVAVREHQRSTRSGLDAGVLPGKLADCSTTNPALGELYVVEGDSAGGSAKQARARETQAVLPLKGKVLNVQKASLAKVLENDEIRAIVTALGLGLQNERSLDALRYHKLILMTDADVDGAHIRTLLLTLLFRHFRPMIEQGHVYIAQPPLFKLVKGSSLRYAYSDSERDDVLAEWGVSHDSGSVRIQRYKGLGEQAPDELWETTMNPETRTLLQVSLRDAEEAEHMFALLMGDAVEPRREFITTRARSARALDGD